MQKVNQATLYPFFVSHYEQVRYDTGHSSVVVLFRVHKQNRWTASLEHSADSTDL